MCPKKVHNIYQHCRDVHKTRYRDLNHSPSEKSDVTARELTQLSMDAIRAFMSWLTTVDGTKLSQKTADMYGTCVKKVMHGACSGSLSNWDGYPEWMDDGKYLQQLSCSLTPSTLSTYMQSMKLFMEFLSCKGQTFRIQSSLKSSLPREAAATFQRWHASLRKDRQQQKVGVVANSQSTVPRVADSMRKYKSSHQFR